jgi:hypothetical protein
MNTIKIYGDIISFKGQEFTIDALYTSTCLKASDTYAFDVIFDSYFVNELFQSTFQPYFVFKHFIDSENIIAITLDKPNLLLHAFSLDIAKTQKVVLQGKCPNFLLLKNWIRAHFFFLGTAMYLILCMLRIPKRNIFNNHPQDTFIITRSVSAEKKLRNFPFPKYNEDFRSKTSIYSYFNVLQRVYWVFQSYYNALSQLSIIKSKVEEYVGKYSVAIAYSFYASRMVHTMVYEKVLDAFFKGHSHQTLYTGNNLDRFSLVEEVIASKYGIKTVCIPHGLEYGFRFPKGFSCDIFYTTSSRAAQHLNILYHTNKFIFDLSIAERMFTIPVTQVCSSKKVIFFTEPREIEVNLFIVKQLVPKLAAIKVPLYIKLHPKDSKENYAPFDIQYIDCIEKALVGNVCFARKSTTLLECIYNRSKAAAILINCKDEALFNTFPSLQSDAIQITKNIDSLFAWIELNIRDETHE